MPVTLLSATRSAATVLFALASFASSFSAPAQTTAQEPPATQPTTQTPRAPGPPLPDSPRPQPSGTLTLGERARLEAHTTFGLGAFITPALDAAVDMADPPDHYPREWRDGGAAFGRLYGVELLRHTAAGVTHFSVAALDHEDPRYFPSTSHNYAGRFVHSMAFTIVDRSNGGHRTLAFSNLAGSAAGGFVTLPIYPHGYNDVTHSYQRSAVELTSFASHNLIAEFSPEIIHVFKALHLPDGFSNAVLPYDARRSNPVTHNPQP
jgi:hypothetical protein